MRVIAGLIFACFVLSAGVMIWDYFGTSGRQTGQNFPQTETFRIVTMGTSLTARGIWPEVVQEVVAQCSNRRVDLVRVAKSGERSDWGLEHLDEAIVVKSDLLLIEFAVNDADMRDGLWPWQSLINHRAIVEGARGALPETEIWLIRSSPAFGARGLTRLPRPVYRRLYGLLAVQQDIGLLDTRPAWRLFLRDHDRREALPDDLHPTAWADQMVTGRVVSGAICRRLNKKQINESD